MFLLALNPAAALAFFLGNWTCVRGGAHPRTMSLHVSRSVGGAWLRTETFSPQSIDPKRPFMQTSYTGFSVVSHRYVRVNVNNFGGYWIEESHGWNGSALIWRDTSSEDGESGITTITRTGPHSYRSHRVLTMRGKPEKSPPDVICAR